MTTTIRAVTPEDAPEWVRLRQALWPDCSPERHALETRELLLNADTGGTVLVAARVENDRALVGFAEVSVRRDHVEGTTAAPVAYLEGWFVEPASRAWGVGRRLLAAAESWAAGQGFAEIASDAELDHAPAHHAHLRAGFREVGRSVHFVKTLSASPAPNPTR